MNTVLYYVPICSARMLTAAIVVLLIVELISSLNNVVPIFAQIQNPSAKQLAKYHIELCISATENNDTRNALLHCQFAADQLTQLAPVQ
jgi:hypothetical protein